MTENNTPFEQTDSGEHLVMQPVDGMAPDKMTVVVDDVTYELSGYVGKDLNSHVHPDILAYRYCVVEDGDA